MKSKEQLAAVFNEGILEKKGLVVAIEVAIGLLLLALTIKYGKTWTTEIQKKVNNLMHHKQLLQEAIENDDIGNEPGTESAAQKASRLNQLYYELSQHADPNWSHTAIQIFIVLPELLRHRGPKDG